MNEHDYFEEPDDEDPPSSERSLVAGDYLRSVVEKIGTGGLQYTDYINPDSNCSIAVNVHDLEILGSIHDYDITNRLPAPLHRNVNALERRVSRAMARTAARFDMRPSLDSEHDYLVFVSQAPLGSLAVMIRQPDMKAMLTADRDQLRDTLRIRSEYVRTEAELRILLGGLATFLDAVETVQ